MTDVYDFPNGWYDHLVSKSYNLRSLNQSANTNWNGMTPAPLGPHTQLWVASITFAPLPEYPRNASDPVLQDVDAFFTRLRGRAGVLRMGNALRLAPWRDRHLTSGVSTFSDGSTFVDGSGFVSGLLPPNVYLVNAATAGARYLTLAGFPVSTANVMRPGDLLQIKPSGIAGTVPHLYKAMYGGDSDASGQIGIAIEPGLRQGVAAGDTVSLRTAATLFRMADDSQFAVEETESQIGNCGGALVEALDLVT